MYTKTSMVYRLTHTLPDRIDINDREDRNALAMSWLLKHLSSEIIRSRLPSSYLGTGGYVINYNNCMVAVCSATALLHSVDWPQYGYNNSPSSIKETLWNLKQIAHATKLQWKEVYRHIIGAPVYKNFKNLDEYLQNF